MENVSNEVMKNKLCVSKVPIFNNLEHEEMVEIAKMSQHKKFEKKELIFRADDPSSHLYIVHKGRVKIYSLAESGKEQLVRIMEPGDFMGELAIFKEEPLTCFAETMEAAEICMIPKKDVVKLLMVRPEVSLKILSELSTRLKDTEESLERFRSKDAEKRLASYLVELGIKAHDPAINTLKITLPMSKKDLASYLGMTQETVSRRLASFQERGWIMQEGQRKIIISELETLKEASI
ncbi:Crp/Fnr family transcriptional regulator [Virgibacillus sp. DJP39]|uniref:Crp/Fnr family transcriptional regulator n=1 Tax=Virgibacillus sp. DJP39 TaxID=3409790 RepID=UPI003BB75168